jgi:hypothetical protein
VARGRWYAPLSIMAMGLLQPFSHLVNTSRRVKINLEDSETGPRIGGNPPKGVAPAVTLPSTRYFVTLPLGDDGAMELSLFTRIDWDDQTCYESNHPNNLWKNVSRLQALDSALIQCIIHPRAPRSRDSELKSELIGRSLTIESETPDVVAEPGGELLLGSKVGGRPYFYYNTLSYVNALNRLFEQGFCLFFQYTEGGYGGGQPFLSPFGEYTFHLLGKETAEGIIWRYGWG